LYPRVPPNGLVVYCGTIISEDGKEKKVNIAFEPHKPINTSLYLCDNKFHTEALSELLESDLKYGFIVVDGSGCLYGTLSGNTRNVLHKFTVELPKKHGRGGQSSVRFARLRMEKRHNYLRKVTEGCVQHFINPADSVPNVSGLILAGLADFKNDLFGSDMFDQRLKRIVVDVVDTSYGFENGFNQAIELSAERLKDVKFIKEKKLISSFFDQIAQDTGRYCFGIRDCLYACDAGAVEILIVWENLETERFVLGTPEGPKTLYFSEEQADKPENFKDPKTNQDYEILERALLVEWLAENYKKFGCSLQFVTDRSQEGMQFVKGFGGIGSLLRYKIDFNTLDDEEEAMKNEDDEYDFFY
jgi:peptide chain release factor subunit 1